MPSELLTKDVRYIKGIGEQRARAFKKNGVNTLFDLISYFPRTYQDRRILTKIEDIKPDTTVSVAAMAAGEVKTSKIRDGLTLSRLNTADETGTMTVTFFNQIYIKDTIKPGETYLFYGKTGLSPYKKELLNPVFELVPDGTDPEGGIVPVYPLSAGLSQKIVSRAVAAALAECADALPDLIPDGIRRQYGLAHAQYAYEHIHMPSDFGEIDLSRKRLVFEELFMLSAGLALLSSRRGTKEGQMLPVPDMNPFCSALGFDLTGAQKRCIKQAQEDMASGRLMNRLVQGDVGSGKTAVAAALIYTAAQSGAQSVLMAPTEILATQHYDGLAPMMERFGIRTVLLTGSMNAAEKRAVYAETVSGEAQLIIGTHALIQQKAEYKNLALAICDEQHRFGVAQRAQLSAKGKDPHILVMSATPIPRTLALIMYGDLDISVLDEMPPGRQKVETMLIGEDKRERMNGFIRDNVRAGKQAYIVCPLVDESDKLELKSVTEFAATLREKTFTGLNIGFLHGRMAKKEKDEVMSLFNAGQTDILVSTTVIEVGVNVPNATIMVIENAERFGLSQLHQLRGRVGRGSEKSYCILISSDGGETERLKVLCKTNDGFAVSKEDLRIRGPGDFFGRRQHGLPDMHIADLSSGDDLLLLTQAQEAARGLVKQDLEMINPDNRRVYERIRDMFADENIFN